MSSGKILLGVLACVAAGALLGVLFAPDKGWNTRKRISKKADDYADSLTEKFNEFVETVAEKIDVVKDEASEFIEQAKSAKEEVKKDVKVAAV